MPRLVLFNNHSQLTDYGKFYSQTALEHHVSASDLDRRIANSPVPLRFARREGGPKHIVRVFAESQVGAAAWIVFNSEFELNCWWAAMSHRMGDKFNTRKP